MKTSEEIKHGLDCCTNQERCFGHRCEYFGDYPICITNLLRDALEYINELEAKTPRWISVEDDLPEKDTEVMVYDKGGLFGLAYYDSAGTWHSYATCYRITHWMPLPEAPEEG